MYMDFSKFFYILMIFHIEIRYHEYLQNILVNKYIRNIEYDDTKQNIFHLRFTNK